MSRIALGTAQFGADYGISNRDGRPNEAEVAAILSRAVDAGIGYLDTAVSYAEAEALIGRHLRFRHPMRIVTKLPPISDKVITASHIETVLAALSGSLERLRMMKVYGVLLHQVRDLEKPGWQYLLEALQEARSRGWASRIGVSVYDDSDLALVESRFAPDIVQLPLNAFDRRLAESGWLKRLRASGAEIHARSIFLQGLLLMEPATLPRFFAPVGKTLGTLHAAWAENNLTPLSGCLSCVLGNFDVDVAVVGVNRVRELNEIEAAASALGVAGESARVVVADSIYLDPRRWPTTLQ